MSNIYNNTENYINKTQWNKEMYDIYIYCENRLIELTKPLQLST